MTKHNVVSSEEWLAARKELLKAAMKRSYRTAWRGSDITTSTTMTRSSILTSNRS